MNPYEKQAVEVKGLAKLRSKLVEMAAMVNGHSVYNIFLEGAAYMADAVKSEAPEDEGTLKKGIVAKNFKETDRGVPGAFVAVDSRIAPHAHLVEYGTHERRAKNKKNERGAIMSTGKPTPGTPLSEIQVFGTVAAPMKPNPFFRRGVSKSKRQAGRIVRVKLGALIRRAARGS
jgi:HK97 gp10 family phage protein